MKSIFSLHRCLATLAILAGSLLPSRAHNLDTTATSISFADNFIDLMSQRATLNQSLIQAGDEAWILLKTTPGPGTNTGVGGYQTFYVPDGIQVIDAAYVFPDTSDPRGFRNIPMKGQSPIAIGNGSIASATSTELIGFTLPGVNGLGVKYDPVTATGVHRGTLAGVYADTGIFYSTDPRTVFNSYGAPVPPSNVGQLPMANNSGDTVGEYFAANVLNSNQRNVLGVMTLWDSYQLRAYGRKDVAPLLDSNGRGNAPWGLANVVAGPQSGYAWEFDYNAYVNTPGTNAQKMQAAIKIGPWNRVKYPGSQMSTDQPGLISNVLGQAGVDASLMGIESTAIPANATAVRFAIGQLELGRPEYSAVKVRINVTPGQNNNCTIMNADAFGGDAGGTEGGKDHIWRYFDPTVVVLNPCTFLQKVVSKSLVAPGETFYYDITFANTGSVALPNFSIVDTLPSGLVHVSAVPAPTTIASPNFTWNFGTVQPGQVVTIRQYVKATGTGTLFNTATAKSGTTTIGVAQASVEVGVRAILNKSKSVTPSNAAPGSTVAYTLEIENIGTGNNGVPLRVREFLPAGFTYQSFVSATLNGAAISSPTLVVDSTNTSQPLFTVSQGIQPGKKLVITFNALIGPNVQPGTYWNSFQLEYEGKVVPPIPEAPVTVGGGQIGDTVFRDWNGNGTQDAGDSGLPGVTVSLYRDADNNGSYETFVGTKVTDSNGNYLFTGLAAGNYQVSVPTPGSGGVPSGYTLTADPDGSPFTTTHNVTVTASQVYLNADWGYQPAGTGSIGDLVFEDLNKNGSWDSGEPGISNVTVNLYHDLNGNGILDPSDPVVATDVSDVSGAYNFPGLDTTLDYLVRVDTSDADINSYFNTTYGDPANQLTSTNPQAISDGFTTVTTADFGFWRAVPSSIGDLVFIDNNKNGSYDGGDLPLPGITVNLYAADGTTLLATTVSGLDGSYLFGGLPAGTYVVKVDTTDPDIPGYLAASIPEYTGVTLNAGDNDLTRDFPFTDSGYLLKEVNLSQMTTPGNLTFTLRPTYPGPALLVNAQVRDAVPAGTTFVSAGQGGSNVPPVTWNLGSNSAAINGTTTGGGGGFSTPYLVNTSTNNVEAQSISLSRPANTAENDLMLASIVVRRASAATSVTAPGGWTLIRQDQNGTAAGDLILVTYRKFAGTPAADPGPYSFTLNGGANVRTAGGISSYRNVSLSNPIDVHGGQANAASTSVTAPSVTTTVANTQLVGFFAARNGDTAWTAPSQMYETFVSRFAGANDRVSLQSAGQLFGSAAATGSRVATIGNSVINVGQLIALRPGTAANIGFVGSASNFVRGGTSIVVNKPAGTIENDVMIASFSWQLGSSFTPVVPSGWVQIGATANSTNSHGQASFYKVAGASEGASYTFSMSGSTRFSVGVLTYRGVDTTNPINAHNVQVNASSASAVAPSITPSVPNTLLVSTFASKLGTPTILTWPTGMTPRFDISSQAGGGNEAGNAVADQVISAANVATGTRTATLDAAAINIGRTIALAPATGVTYDTTTALATNQRLLTSGSTVTVTLTASATGDAGTVTPPTDLIVNGVNSASATKLSGPTPASAAINNGSQAFTYTYEVTAGANPGSVTFSGTPTDSNGNWGLGTSPSVLVTPPLTLTVNVPNSDDYSVITNVGQLYNNGSLLAESPPTQTTLDGSIGDFVWADLNADGIQDVGEPGLGGVTVYVDLDENGQYDPGEPFAVTDYLGSYRIPGLLPDTYVVRYDASTLPAGYLPTTPASISHALIAGEQYEDADFGFKPPGTGVIGNYLWLDSNNDGVQDPAEGPLTNIGVILEKFVGGNWIPVATTTTGLDGFYQFTALTAGDYRVTVDPTSQVSSPYAQGTFNLGNVMAPTYDLDNGTTSPNGVTLVTLATDSTVIDTADFGYNWSGTIGDFVWWDYNANGNYDPAAPQPEVGIFDARVQLYFDHDFDGVFDLILGDTEIQRVFTNASGFYQFTNLPPGNYFVDVYEDSMVTGGVRNIVPTTDDIVPVNLTTGSMNVDTADFGYFEGARVEALVFWDENGNGIRDGSEDRLANIPVTLIWHGPDGILGNGDDVTYNKDTTDTGYIFFLVPEGEYTISYDIADVTAAYPGLGTETTASSFEFAAVAGEDGVRFFDFGVDNTGEIGDTVFADLDGTSGEGVGPGVGDPGLPGVTVNLYLDLNGDGTIDFGAGDLLLETTVTDAQGNYLFTGLPDTTGAQEYMIEVLATTVPPAYQQTASSYPTGGIPAASTFSTTLTGGVSILTADFGYPLVPDVYYALSGTVYDDNGNGGGTASDGIQNGTEPGIQNVKVTLEIDEDGDNTYDQTYVIFTDSNGDYSFSAVPEGANVRITVDPSTLPSNAFVQTGDPNGVPLSNVWTITDMQANAPDLDFGYVEDLGSIAGTIVKGNGNGTAEGGEPVLAGVTVTLTWFGPDGIPGTLDDVVDTTTTDGFGNYQFTDLYPGGYEITTSIPGGYHAYADADGVNPNSINVSLAIGDNVTDRDFEYQSGSLSGTLWTDTNADGAKDVGEPFLAGVTVFLDLDNNGSLGGGEPSTTTNVSGFYQFTGLNSGSYDVRVVPATLPAGSLPSYDVDGIASAHVAAVSLTPNQVLTDVDFGYYQLGAISGTVKADIDNDNDGDTALQGVTLTLKDANGNDIDSDPITPGVQPTTTLTDVNGAYTFANVTPGSYQVVETDPAGYISVSPNTVSPVVVNSGATTANIDFVDEEPADVSGYLYVDANGNGDKDLNEMPISGVRVFIDLNNDGIWQPGEPSAVTNATGYYLIEGLPAGGHDVTVDTSTLPAGVTQTGDPDNTLDHETTVTLAAGQSLGNQNFGYQGNSSIGDLVWYDINGDGDQDVGEPGLSGVTVYLDLNNDGTMDAGEPRVVTSGSGAYSFPGLIPGTYHVRVDDSTLGGLVPSYDKDGIGTPDVATVVLPAATNLTDIDFGYEGSATITGHLYKDVNGNGTQDPGEPALPGIDVLITDDLGGTQTVVTDSNGDWSALVVPGHATADIDENDPQYPTGTTQTEGTDPTIVMALEDATVHTDNDGFFLPGTITGTVKADIDNDNDGDTPLGGVTVTLKDSNGNDIDSDAGTPGIQPTTTTTAPDGSYSFGNLPPGNYTVVETDPSGYNSVTSNTVATTVTAGGTSTVDFVDEQPGTISGFVLADTNNDNTGDSGIMGVTVTLKDSNGDTVATTATAADGSYSFTGVTPGSYTIVETQPSGYQSVSDVDGGNLDIIGDVTPVAVSAGATTANQNFVEEQYGTITGTVKADIDNDNDGDTPLGGVTVTLKDSNGNDIDSDPGTPGMQPTTTTTAPDGSYSFGNLPPGNYTVVETDPSGYNSVTSNTVATTVTAGGTSTVDFVDEQPGTISGFVLEDTDADDIGDAPLSGVTVTLKDASGNDIDSDPLTGGVQPTTTLTLGDGSYSFGNLPPGNYGVKISDVTGYVNLSDKDGGDLTEIRPITVIAGQTNPNNDFVLIKTCPSSWAHWLQLHPGETAGGNTADNDAYDNFAEFAFAMPYDSGVSGEHLDGTAWIIRPSTTVPGTLEAVFVRPKGAPLNVTYTLQYAAALGNPTTWQEIVIDTGIIGNATTADNGDCTETVTIPGLDTATITGLIQEGFVRIKAVLDEDSGPGGVPDGDIDHTSYTEVEGWTETDFGICCKTYNVPYLLETQFTGTVSSVSSQALVFNVETDLSTLLAPGASYYLEVTSGDHEGHRFDVVSATGNSLVLASDGDLYAATAPFNTMTGAPPSTLAGDTVALRRHRTLDEIFPPTSPYLSASGLRATADEVQLFVGGLEPWQIFWLYDENDGNPATARWVNAADNLMNDMGGTIIPPGQGLFFNNRVAGTETTLLAYGEVRENHFLRPLSQGHSLVGGGFPINQSAKGTGGRAMSLATGFFGSRDFKTADSFLIWRGDALDNASSYDTYFLANSASRPGNWIQVGDASATVRDSTILLLRNRSVFIRAKNALPTYTMPNPWSADPP